MIFDSLDVAVRYIAFRGIYQPLPLITWCVASTKHRKISGRNIPARPDGNALVCPVNSFRFLLSSTNTLAIHYKAPSTTAQLYNRRAKCSHSATEGSCRHAAWLAPCVQVNPTGSKLFLPRSFFVKRKRHILRGGSLVNKA